MCQSNQVALQSWLRRAFAGSIALGLTVFLCVLAPAAEHSETSAKGPKKLKKVVVCFKTHFDIGYTDLASKVIESYRTTMIDQALEVYEASKALPPEHRFVWTLAGWPMTQVLWPGQTPERRARVEEAIRRGRLVWHALPGTTHTASLELEDFVRGMGFSSALSRRFDQPLPHDAKMTDVPSHSWIVPTVLHHAGVEFFHLGSNRATAAPDLPMLFWWEGPDGSRVLTMYMAEGYGSELVPPSDWPHATWLALIHSGDNQGPPPPDVVQKLLARAERELPGVEIQLGRLSDFSDALLAEKPELPVVKADVPDWWIHGLGSMPIETKMARNARAENAALESLNALLRGWGCDVPPAAETVANTYEQTLMYGEHTWGHSMGRLGGWLYGEDWKNARGSEAHETAEESWREQGAYARRAKAFVVPALRQNLRALAAAVSAEGPRVVVYNPLPWPRGGVVEAAIPPSTGLRWKDAETGQPVPAQREADMLLLAVDEVPPLGYRTFVPGEASAGRGPLRYDEPAATLENDVVKLRLDPARCAVTSLVDKRSGRELVDSSSGYALGQYLYERFDAEMNEAYLSQYCRVRPRWAEAFGKPDLPEDSGIEYSATSPKDAALEVIGSTVALKATMRASADENIPQPISLEVSVYRDAPYVDFTWRIENKQPEPWPEAGWLCFPLRVERPRYQLGRIGSVVDPATQLQPGSNHEMFCVSSGMTAADSQGRGVGICPIDAPLLSIGRPGVLRYSRSFGSREPDVFVHLFNNTWGTNFQQWIGGNWSVRVRIWPVDERGDTAGSLISPGSEARSGLLAAAVDGSAGELPLSQTGLRLSREGVLVTALGDNPDGSGTLLRLWEHAGREGPCRVQLPQFLRAEALRPCDLRGRPTGEALPVDADGWVNLSLGRYVPASLLIQQ